MLGAPKSWSQPPWRSCFICLLPAAGLHTLNRSQPPRREKASWALSFHLCQPPPAPLQNEGHFKRRSSLHSSQLLLLQGHALFSAVCVQPTPRPLSALSRWEGPAAPLGQLLLPFIQTTPLLPVEWSSRQHCPPPSSVSAGPSPSVG